MDVRSGRRSSSRRPAVRWAFYLEDSGAVVEGVGVADVVDQADDVAGQVVVRQVVKVGEDFVELGSHKEQTPLPSFSAACTLVFL